MLISKPRMESDKSSPPVNEAIEDILVEVLADLELEVEDPGIRTAAIAEEEPESRDTAQLTDLQRIRLIERAIEEVRPTLLADGEPGAGAARV